MQLQLALLMILSIAPAQNGANGGPLATFKGGWNAITCVAFFPDGKKIAAGSSWEGCVRLWDVASGRSEIVARQDEAVNSVAFTRDGKWLATGGLGSKVRVWEMATGRERFTLNHEQSVESVAFSPDGTLLASAGSAVDNSVKLWSLKKQKPK
jgi:WD40 repeat protein